MPPPLKPTGPSATGQAASASTAAQPTAPQAPPRSSISSTTSAGEHSMLSMNSGRSNEAQASAPRQKSGSLRQRLLSLGRKSGPAELPVFAVATVGDGVSAGYTNAFLAETRKQVPKELRDIAAKEDGKYRLVNIGPNKTSGGGRAYTEGRGYTGHEPVNLLPRQMEFTEGLPTPIDAEMLKLTLDLDDRRLANKRPFHFGEHHVEELNGLTYTLSSDLNTGYGLDKYNKKAKRRLGGRASETQGVSRRIFGRYVADTVRTALKKSSRVSLDNIQGEVTNVRYNAEAGLFHLRIKPADGGPAMSIRAQNVVLAVGHQPDTLPAAFEHLKDSPDVHYGEDAYRKFSSEVPQRAAELKGKRGLIVGTGLQMNDLAVKMQDHGVESFSAVSRGGNTHELPQDVPRQPELEPIAEKIYDLLDFTRLQRSGPSLRYGEDGPKEFVERMQQAFVQARAIAESHQPQSNEPLIIRGQKFDRGRVQRALLSQYVAFRYENLRGAALRMEAGNERANEVVRLGLDAIDFHPDHSSWLTTSRTSTTDRNIQANQRMREQGQLRADGIKAVVPDKGRYRVEYASGAQEHVDYFIISAGRKPLPGDKSQLTANPLVADLLDQGLVRPHPIGLGVDMDKQGRAKPDPERFSKEERPGLYVVSPSLSKSELLAPKSKDREPLNNVVAESVMGLRPLAKQVAENITLNIFGWRPTPEHQRDYVYREGRVDIEDR